MPPVPRTVAAATSEHNSYAAQHHFPEPVQRQPRHGNYCHHKQCPEKRRFGAEGFKEVGKGFVHGG